MKTVLKVDNLTKTFYPSGKPPVMAVDHISLELHEGEILGIVGESGSGKSTLAKLITRLTDATEGKITVNGKDITNVKGKELRDVYKEIQMVFQNPVDSFNPRRTLGQGIGESLQNSGMPKAAIKKRVEELLVQCGLPADFARRYPHEVSGGECQRAAIARALAINPKILICDEATSSLDVTVQKQIMDLLTDLQKKNHMSYIFICHNLALVQMLCDRVIVLYDGKIVEEGTPDDVILEPQSDYTKKLVDSVLG
ncbi:MAG: ABC transporter ATP-binding protein [Muricoprocola sp.]